jgi:hypothetical protein
LDIGQGWLVRSLDREACVVVTLFWYGVYGLRDWETEGHGRQSQISGDIGRVGGEDAEILSKLEDLPDDAKMFFGGCF